MKVSPKELWNQKFPLKKKIELKLNNWAKIKISEEFLTPARFTHEVRSYAPDASRGRLFSRKSSHRLDCVLRTHALTHTCKHPHPHAHTHTHTHTHTRTHVSVTTLRHLKLPIIPLNWTFMSLLLGSPYSYTSSVPAAPRHLSESQFLNTVSWPNDKIRLDCV